MKQLDLGLGPCPPDASADARHPVLSEAHRVLELLRQWQEVGWIQPLDARFAAFLHQQCPDASGLLLLAAALASHQLARGHVCLDLNATLAGPTHVLDLPPEHVKRTADNDHITPAVLLENVSFRDWAAALHPRLVSDGARVTPLVHENGRLYLYRYWKYEQEVGRSIASRLVSAEGHGFAPEAVRQLIDILFGAADPNRPDWQRVACALAVRSRFSIITGGPGTGKTTTVVRLLALLQALHFADGEFRETGRLPGLRIRLAAPTGKAAARLSESIAGRVEALPWERLPGGTRFSASIPTRVTTLHRLLGGRPHSRVRRFNADEPLPLDVLVIDEASMVSLSQIADVVEALPPSARLILIGDKDQLASVEAGAVLGELCRRAEGGHYRPDMAAWLHQASGVRLPAEMIDPAGRALDQVVAMLRISHRFDAKSGIGQLARAVNAGDADAVLQLLEEPPGDLAYIKVASTQDAVFRRCVIEGRAGGNLDESRERKGLKHYLEIVASPPADTDQTAWDAWALQVLQAHRRCQILCVLRDGPWGVEGLNQALARLLYEQGLIPSVSGWYAGRPIMVTRNNRALNLANGDIGVVLPCPGQDGFAPTLKVAFTDGEGQGVRWFAPNRLDDVETVYALTVHKSQGSEFDHAVLILPPMPTPVLTRELLYTGITRASRWFSLVNSGSPSLIRQTIHQRVYRSGGLGELLHALR